MGSTPFATTNLSIQQSNGGCYDTAKRNEGQDNGWRLKRVRVRGHHERDFNLYLKFGEMLSYTPTQQEGNPDSYTPIQCYVLMDSHGERSGPYPCTDYKLLEKVQKGKGNVNLQIQMWVETTLEEPTILLPDELKEILKDYPEWVFTSYVNRLSKEYFKKHGWTPTFIRKHLTS